MNAPYIEESTRIEAALFSISPDLDREQWWKVAAALKSELGDAGFDLFDRWSQGGGSYSATDARDTWKSTKASGGITVNSLFSIAKDHGFDLRQVKPAPIDPAEVERRRAERAERDRQEAEKRAAEHARAANLVMTVTQAATKAAADHPYLVRKGIAPAGRLYEMAIGRLADLIGYRPKADGEHLDGRILVAPVSMASPPRWK